MSAMEDRLFSHMPPEGKWNGASVLVLPGGGYKDVVKTLAYEGTDIAAWLSSVGFAAFTLQYTLQPRGPFGRARGVEPAVEEGVTAFRQIHRRLTQSGQCHHGTCIMGFSAGAHLAMCICRAIAEDDDPPAHPPKGVVLAYPPARNPLCPCIAGSLIAVPRGVDKAIPWGRWLSPGWQHRWCDLAAAALAMPPTLIVCSNQDMILTPSKHGLLIADALKSIGVPLTYIQEDLGPHGFALKGWSERCNAWLCDLFPVSTESVDIFVGSSSAA